MLRQFIDRFSWVNLFLKAFQVAVIILLIVGVYNTVVADRYTDAQWATLVFAGLAQGSM